MKYKILLKTLRLLIYIKRFFWFLGRKFYQGAIVVFRPIVRAVGFVIYKFSYWGKKFIVMTGIGRQFFRRDILQAAVFIILFFVVIPQTRLYSKTDNLLPGQKTIAYKLVSVGGDFQLEEVTAQSQQAAQTSKTSKPSWKQGAVSSEENIDTELLGHDRDLPAATVAGGMAVTEPIIFPGAVQSGHRNKIENYVVLSGDTLSGIAYKFGISIATVLWENNLGLSAILQPGDKLRILPVSGLTHKVKRGETLISIAKEYGVKSGDIAKFNRLKADGSNLKAGEVVIVPNGVRHAQALAVAPSRTSYYYGGYVPPASTENPSASGFTWPAAMRDITQYYSWYHPAIDISGPVGQARGSATYAAKSGVVEVAQCGWNSGYGCYIIINHGNGVKTLYGHHEKLLVSAGEYVQQGQTIGLMGNTGRVYGYDGVHVHFEIRINRVRVNPLSYIR